MKSHHCASTAIAAVLLGSFIGTSNAADLGGGCCDDLEARVAELEAATARKGNRVVSLQIYGQVNKALLFWDDGRESDAYIVDNELSSSRTGLKGSARLFPGWSAGFNIEFEINDAQSSKVTQGWNGDDPEGTLSTYLLRQNYWYIESERYGRLALGHQSVAADGAYEVNLSNSMRTSDIKAGNSFFIRKANGELSRKRLGDWANNFDAARNDVVRYDTPAYLGFILSASWGDNDYADVALRFRRDFGAFRAAAALAYQWDNQNQISPDRDRFFIADSETFGGSISFQHLPTGLYAAFQAAARDYKDPTRQDGTMWYLQAGVDKRYFFIGATTIYGEVGQYINVTNFVPDTDRTATRWGFGANQKIDTAAMDVYFHATFYSFDDGQRGASHDYEDFSTLLLGSRIQF